MAKKRKQLVIDEEALKCAAKRMKETHRKSFNNYIEHLILEDCHFIKIKAIEDDGMAQ